MDRSTPLPLKANESHIQHHCTLSIIIFTPVIIILLSITLLFVHTQAYGNRIIVIVSFVFVVVCGVVSCRLYRTTVQLYRGAR